MTARKHQLINDPCKPAPSSVHGTRPTNTVRHATDPVSIVLLAVAPYNFRTGPDGALHDLPVQPHALRLGAVLRADQAAARHGRSPRGPSRAGGVRPVYGEGCMQLAVGGWRLGGWAAGPWTRAPCAQDVWPVLCRLVFWNAELRVPCNVGQVYRGMQHVASLSHYWPSVACVHADHLG